MGEDGNGMGSKKEYLIATLLLFGGLAACFFLSMALTI